MRKVALKDRIGSVDAGHVRWLSILAVLLAVAGCGGGSGPEPPAAMPQAREPACDAELARRTGDSLRRVVRRIEDPALRVRVRRAIRVTRRDPCRGIVITTSGNSFQLTEQSDGFGTPEDPDSW